MAPGRGHMRLLGVVVLALLLLHTPTCSAAHARSGALRRRAVLAAAEDEGAPAAQDDSTAAADSSSSSSHHHQRHQHQPHITVTGVEVGERGAPPLRDDDGDAAGPVVGGGDDGDDPPGGLQASPSKQQQHSGPNLIGDLISAASGDSNGTSIAQVLDKALAKEFAAESKSAESSKQGRTFNETVHSEEAKVETVVRISAGKSRDKDETPSSSTSSSSSGKQPADGSSSSSGGGAAGSSAASGAASGAGSSTPAGSAGASSSSSSKAGGTAAAAAGGAAGNRNSSSSSGADAADVPSIEKGVDRIIDSHDNEFVLSAPPKDQVATLTLDPLLIQDLTFLIASAAAMGLVFEALKQPVINGYLVAGAIVGPGGLQLIKELVQVESLAQLGVQLLLFHLGRELSFSKLRSVWSVALLGGALQIVALSALGGIIAAAVESPVTQGIFVGALLSMSSTSVVAKCLQSYRLSGTAFGQITIGTLILQDCSVGVMFALMPAFGAAAAGGAAAAAAAGGAATSGAAAATAAAAAAASSHAALLGISLLVAKVLMKLLLLVMAAGAAARLVLPVLLRLLVRHASGELVQLSLVSMCLCSAWLCGKLGLSEELGAFVAGAMMSVAETRLVAAGQLLPSSAPHTPASKGHMSAPATPNGESALSPSKTGVATASGKHNSAAVAYYRHATAQRQQQQQQAASSAAQRYRDEGGDASDALLSSGQQQGGGDLDAAGLAAQLHSLHAQQHQALLTGAAAGSTAAAGAGQQQHRDGGEPPAGSSAGLLIGAPVGCSSEASSGLGGGGGGNVCANIESIQNVLIALFVASMGLIMSPVFLWHHAGVLLCGTLLVTLLKAAVVTGVVRMFNVPLRLSISVGLSMAHIGEFSFVLLSMASQLKLLSTQVYMLLLGMTAMSLLTTPFIFLGVVHLLGKDHHQVYITGPRLRLSCDRE